MSVNHAKAIEYPPLNGIVGRQQSICRAEVRIARSFDDLLMVYSVRSAVYIAEQECPFAEEFDGNDHCATHFIGFIKGAPAGCIRARCWDNAVPTAPMEAPTIPAGSARRAFWRQDRPRRVLPCRVPQEALRFDR